MAHRGRKSVDDILIMHLAGGATRASAAKAAGCSERTVFRRLQDSTFRQQVQEARTTMMSDAVGRLSAAASAAASTLYKLLSAESETVRLGAARAILELAPKLRESEELAVRVDALEAAQTRLDDRRSSPWVA